MVATVRRCAENVGFVLRPEASMPDGCNTWAGVSFDEPGRFSCLQVLIGVAARFVT